MDFLPLDLRVKLSQFRAEDVDAALADAAFRRVRPAVIERDRERCRFCGIQAPNGRGLEVHHLNDDHQDNREENLVTACMLCHSVFHFGLACAQGRGFLVPARGVSQRAIIHAMSLFWFEARLSVVDVARAQILWQEWFDRGRRLLTGDLSFWADGSSVGNAWRSAAQAKDTDTVRRIERGVSRLCLVPVLSHEPYQQVFRLWTQHYASRWTPNRIKSLVNGDG